MSSIPHKKETHSMPVQRYLFVSHTWDEEAKKLIVHLKGHLDYHAVHILRHYLDEIRREVAQAMTVFFDLRNITKLDSAGIGLLLVLFHKLNGHNQKLAIQNVPSVFQIDLKDSPLATCIPITYLS